LNKVTNPETIQIQQSIPYRMRRPDHQALFFKLLSKLLCYLVSGENAVGYLAKDEGNPAFKIATGLEVYPPPLIF
jgi:hypothetical protein